MLLFYRLKQPEGKIILLELLANIYSFRFVKEKVIR